ncbi:MAG: ABC transporter permease, partial [Mucilaginibacter sp.]
MIKNYIKIALRSLWRNKGFTAINVLGLSVGLAVCLLIVFYVVDELSYDRYNAKADRIYRVNEDLKLGNNNVLYAVCMPPLAKTLISDFPEVEDAVRLKNAGSFHVNKGSETIIENGVAFADASIFNIFTLPMIQGRPANALSAPNSLVITESIAKKYFNTANVIGKTLKVNNNQLLNITGVIKDVPTQSHFKFDFFISMSTFPDSRSDQWLRSDYNTYVLLRKVADAQKFEAKLPAFLTKYSSAEMQSSLHMSVNAFEKSGSYFRMNLIPLLDIHLHSARTGELSPNGTLQYVYIFSAIALFILTIACINFMNLSTASYSGRAREVGVRKVLGSPRRYLVFQFLTESILITLLSAIIAFTIALTLLPAFDQLSGKTLIMSAHNLAWLLPLSFFIVILVGCIAGSYPAFFLSSFRPVEVLKGSLSTGFKGGRLRSILVVFQFFISIFLIIGTLVIHGQLNYIQTKNLGYNRNQVLVIKQAYELGKQAKLFKQEVKQLPGVINATLTGFIPTSRARGTTIFYKDATLVQNESLFPQCWNVDEDYINTLGMKMIGGRNFSNQMSTDSSGLIINEAAAKFLGFKHPLNRTLYRSMDGNRDHVKPYHIVGVVKDF